MKGRGSEALRICAVSDEKRVDWPMLSWMRLMAERGVSFTLLSPKTPQRPWLKTTQVKIVPGSSLEEMIASPLLEEEAFDVFYFASASAALKFAQSRAIDGRLVIQATNWDLTVAPHLAAGAAWRQKLEEILPRANRVIVATHFLRETAVTFGVAPQKISLISPGINHGFYQPPARPPQLKPKLPIHLLSVLSMEWEDGMEYLLQAIRSCLDLNLPVKADVIGYGRGRQRLYYLIDDFQLTGIVQPVNHLTRAELRDKYRQAHFFLQTNLTDDVPYPTLEAMACGLPPLMFDGPNAAEMLGEPLRGLLAPLRQPQKMAAIMRRYSQSLPDYGALRKKTSQLARRRFRLANQAPQMEAALAGVLAEPALSPVKIAPSERETQPDKVPVKRYFPLSGKSRRLPQIVPLARQRPLPDRQLTKLAAATIAIGEPYALWAAALIESLRKNGRFQGPIFVITDCEQLFTNQDNVHILTVPSIANPMAVKQYKTLLPEWIPFEQILFLDADVLVGRPLQEWYTAVRRTQTNPVVRMFPDEGFFNERYHTGIMLIERDAAESLLKRWRQAMRNGRFQRDQSAFMAVVRPGEAELMPDEFLLFPTIESFKRGQVRTFTHITFTGRQRNFSAAIIHHYLENSFHIAQRPMDNWALNH